MLQQYLPLAVLKPHKTLLLTCFMLQQYLPLAVLKQPNNQTHIRKGFLQLQQYLPLAVLKLFMRHF